MAKYDANKMRALLARKDRRGLTYEQLSVETGIPVFTQDTGPGFIADFTRELFARYGVLPLFSPPHIGETRLLRCR
jgi:hypothetical protein